MAEDKTKRIRELIGTLRAAGRAYYQESREIMSNFEYDKLYDELVSLEKETGIVFANSPTQNVGYEVVSALPKERHEKPMLSLNKTKSVEELADWLGGQTGLLSWKMDGLTIVLTYQNGTLVKAVTRGNGEIGEVITANAKAFVNVPLNISYQGELILRGEAIIRYSDFEKINEQIEDVDAKYKNPRNLCSGSVRQLNSEITAQRQVHFYAFSLVKADGIDFKNSRKEQFEWLKTQGFEVVEYHEVTKETLPETVKMYSEAIAENDTPSDGLVLLYDDIAYGQSLGRTAKFPRDSIAFKWADEIQETKLLYITVYKANMIIPQIADNLTRSGVRDIPEACPVCGGQTEVRQLNDVKSLYCTNPDCQAKKIKSFTLFTSRDALNIAGLSEATLEKFIGVGMIHEYADIFHLDRHQEEIVEMDGFGQKSYDNLIAAAEKASHTTLPRMVYGLGVAGIGLANAKMICRHFKNDFEAMRHATVEELVEIDGIGEVLAQAWTAFFSDGKNNAIVDHLLAELTFEADEEENGEGADETFAGMNFVITGSLEHFKNRKELQELIERRGGKVTGSVTSKTNYLINNDVASSSSKNKKARELGVPILSEEEFLKL